jgi:hypothetical protein
MEAMERPESARPNGPVAAVVLAAGVGSLVLAVLVVLAEAKKSFADSLAYSDRVGPLSGKTTWAVVAFVVVWLAMHLAWRRRDVDLARIALAAAVILIGLALVGTFSPFFELFASD